MYNGWFVLFLLTLTLFLANARSIKLHHHGDSKLYEALMQAKPNHVNKKDSTYNNQQQQQQQHKINEQGLYKLLSSVATSRVIKSGNHTSEGKESFFPFTTQTPGTRPTRPTRPTPPTRPTRATNCPCNQQTCSTCGGGCPCAKKSTRADNEIDASKTRLSIPGGILPDAKNMTLTAANDTSQKKRDFMNEVLDSTLNSNPHSPDHLADFYSNDAKWGTYESPRIQHDSHFTLDYPHYKVNLGFDDTSHNINEDANEIAHNHVESYPGEIVSGENYLSKFIAPALYDVSGHNSFDSGHDQRLHGEQHGRGRARFHPPAGNENHHNYDAPDTHMYGERVLGEHVARDNPARAEEGNRRNKFYGRDENKEDRARQESEEQQFTERNNEKEAHYHNNDKEAHYHNNDKERFQDDERSNNNYHDNNNNNNEGRQQDYSEREQANKNQREEQRFRGNQREKEEYYREEERERPTEGEQREFEEDGRRENNNEKIGGGDDDRDVHIENREQDTMVNMDGKINNINADKTVPYNQEGPSEDQDPSSYRGDSEDESERMRENAELTTNNKNNERNSLENIGEQYSEGGNEMSKFNALADPELSRIEMADDRSMHSERAEMAGATAFERIDEDRMGGQGMAHFSQVAEKDEQINKENAIAEPRLPEEEQQNFSNEGEIREETGTRRSENPTISSSVSELIEEHFASKQLKKSNVGKAKTKK